MVTDGMFRGGHPRSGGGTRLDLVMVICFLAAFLEGYDAQAMAVTAPRMAPEWGLTNATLGIVFSMASAGQLVGASIAGWLCDRIGRKPVFLYAMMFCGIFTLATPFCRDPVLLCAMRFAAGLALGGALPAMIAILADISPPEKRVGNSAFIFAGMPLGGVGVALISSYTSFAIDWHSLFYLGGVMTLLTVPLIALFVPETAPVQNAAANTKRASIFQALFAERRAPITLLLWTLLLPTAMILHLLLSWLPMLAVGKGFDPQTASKTLLSFSIGAFVGGLVLSRLIQRFGIRAVLPLSFCSLIVAAFAVGNSHVEEPFILLSGLLGIFVGGVQMANYGVVGMFYPARIRGTGSGVSFAVGRVGTMLGPFSAGLLLTGGVTPSQIILGLGLIAIVPGVAIFALSFFPAPDDRRIEVTAS